MKKYRIIDIYCKSNTGEINKFFHVFHRNSQAKSLNQGLYTTRKEIGNSISIRR